MWPFACVTAAAAGRLLLAALLPFAALCFAHWVLVLRWTTRALLNWLARGAPTSILLPSKSRWHVPPWLLSMPKPSLPPRQGVPLAALRAVEALFDTLYATWHTAASFVVGPFAYSLAAVLALKRVAFFDRLPRYQSRPNARAAPPWTLSWTLLCCLVPHARGAGAHLRHVEDGLGDDCGGPEGEAAVLLRLLQALPQRAHVAAGPCCRRGGGARAAGDDHDGGVCGHRWCVPYFRCSVVVSVRLRMCCPSGFPQLCSPSCRWLR